MNLSNASFTTYWIALIASGGLLVVMGGRRFGRMSRVEQVMNVVVGLAFAGYGSYLGFAVNTSRPMYLVAFVLPVILVANNLNGWWVRRKAAKMTRQRVAIQANSSGMPVITGSTFDATTLGNAEVLHFKQQIP